MTTSAPAGPADCVVVAGNGPVGQTAALLLARYGIPVVLLDARSARAPVGSKAVCQQRDVLDVWAWAGVPQIAEEGTAWTRTRTFHHSHELFSLEVSDPGACPLPPFVNISQGRTEELLDEAIEREPLIEVRWGHTVVDRQEGDGQVTLHCLVPGGQTGVTGRHAVACGGARGTGMRALVGATFEGPTFEEAFLICDVRADLPQEWEDERRFYFDPQWNPGRQVLVQPCPDSVYRIEWPADPSLDLEVARADGSLDERIRQVLGPDVDYELVWSSIYHFHARLASRFRVGRTLLAGDLAHVVSPFGARGLNSGVGDVDNVAWKLAAVHHGWADEGLLDSYEPERMAAARENIEVTSATMEFLMPHSPAAAARRRALLVAAADDESMRDQVDYGRLAEPFWYVESPLTTPDPTRPWPGRPPRGQPPAPVPGVMLPDAAVDPAEDLSGGEPPGELPGGPLAVPGAMASTGHGLRLRDLVRGRFSLLVDSPEAAVAAGEALDACLPPGAPRAVIDLRALPGAEPVLAGLAWEEGDWWLIRPDAYTAARLPGGAGAHEAIARVLGGRPG